METALTVEDAVKRLLAEAERHREAGRWDVGHEWQTRADELSRLVSLAKTLPKRS